jgi:hypothetical protein
MIDKYLESICRIIVDEFNLISRHERLVSNSMKARYAVTNIHEEDIVFRLGFVFRQMARYRSRGADIQVPYKEFEIQVKYLRYWYTDKESYTGRNKLSWKHIKKDYEWLFKNIKDGRKGKCAFVVCWSPAIPWNELIPLGIEGGANPTVNPSRIGLFPFLDSPGGGFDNVKRDDTKTEGRFPLPIIIDGSVDFELPTRAEHHVDWKLYGTSADMLNILVYY